MLTSRLRHAGIAFVLLVPLAAPARGSQPQPLAHELGAEIARLRQQLAAAPGGEIWDDVKRSSGPLLERAQEALDHGRVPLALLRLAAAREGVVAARYIDSREAPLRHETARFEAEWKRVGSELGGELSPPQASALEGVQPAVARAIGEAALPQVRVYYNASLDYGENTVLDAGLYYVGTALAQSELAGLVRRLGETAAPASPPLRSLAPELDALEAELLRAYRPPASIDHHADFIRSSAALKEARELDSLGLRYGALLRYLQAAQRFAPVGGAAAADVGGPTPGELETRLHGLREQLLAPAVDHTIGRVFLEAAEEAVEPGPRADPAAAGAILESVLPRYLAALGPAPPVPPRPPARATVTLVRWPYT